jgi:hypothetical protein
MRRTEFVTTFRRLQYLGGRRTVERLKGDKLMAAKLVGIGEGILYRKLKDQSASDWDAFAGKCRF